MHIFTSTVTLVVANLPRALAFYTQTLNLELKVHLEGVWAEVVAPGVTLALSPLPEQSAAQPRLGFAIGLLVEDLDAARSELQAKGVAFAPEETDPLMRRAPFTDPDDNPLYLMEYTP